MSAIAGLQVYTRMNDWTPNVVSRSFEYIADVNANREFGDAVRLLKAAPHSLFALSLDGIKKCKQRQIVNAIERRE